MPGMPTAQGEMDGHSRGLRDHSQQGMSKGQSLDHSCS